MISYLKTSMHPSWCNNSKPDTSKPPTASAGLFTALHTLRSISVAAVAAMVCVSALGLSPEKSNLLLNQLKHALKVKARCSFPRRQNCAQCLEPIGMWGPQMRSRTKRTLPSFCAAIGLHDKNERIAEAALSQENPARNDDARSL